MRTRVLGLLLLLSLVTFPATPAYNPISTMAVGRLLTANMNSTADQAIPINLPTGTTTYNIRQIIVTNASTSLTLAAGGVYTATSKGGTAVVAAAQLYSALTSSTKSLALTLGNTDARTETTLYLSLTTAQGSAATADVYVIADVLK